MKGCKVLEIPAIYSQENLNNFLTDEIKNKWQNAIDNKISLYFRCNDNVEFYIIQLINKG
uniref:Uncharacterized protein n=1 Tax=Meloidogyne hapla TaxID=6305 RepID=A0A1I8C287_MELHA